MNCPSKGSSKRTHGVNSKKTLDIQHLNKLNQIQQMKEKIVFIEHRIKELSKDILDFEKKKHDGLATEEDILHVLTIKDAKLDMEREYKKLADEYDEVQYYINTADILYKYYDLVEKGHDNNIIDSDLVNQKNPHTILKYFMQPSVSKHNCDEEKRDCGRRDNEQDVEQSRGTLLEKYMMYTDNNFVSKKCKDTCEDSCVYCGSRNITVMTHDGYSFCNECNTIEYLIIDHDKPSYKDPPKEISYFAYKRINHFQESSNWWAFLQFTAKKLVLRMFTHLKLSHVL